MTDVTIGDTGYLSHTAQHVTSDDSNQATAKLSIWLAHVYVLLPSTVCALGPEAEPVETPMRMLAPAPATPRTIRQRARKKANSIEPGSVWHTILWLVEGIVSDRAHS